MAAPKKEKIKPPTKPTLTAAAGELRKGKKPGARVEADESVAVKQGVAKKRKKGK
jgi:hypothetical protein